MLRLRWLCRKNVALAAASFRGIDSEPHARLGNEEIQPMDKSLCNLTV
jgi:hypothetical protein